MGASHKYVAVTNCWLDIMSVKGINTQHHSAVGGKKSFPEYFYLQSRNDLDHFQFEDAVKAEDLPRCRETYQLETLNSFFCKKRSTKTLHTLYGFCIDIDGIQSGFPLSHLDILERWRALGFSENPSEVRRTSEGRFHVIIKIMPVGAFPEKISYWKQCARGLNLAFEDLGADEFATTNPVGFIRIPGHPNCKYPDKPRVEIVSESKSILTLTDIYQTLKDNGLFGPSFMNKKSIAEMIAILERGVPRGIRNYACFTLAIYYKEQGKSKEETFEKLLAWNEGLAAPDLPSKVVSTVGSAYKNGYSLSVKWLNRLATIALNEHQASPSTVLARSKRPRDKIKGYAEKLRDLLVSEGGYVISSHREIAQKLNIPIRSLSHAVKCIHGLRLQATGKGRSAKTKFVLGNEIPHLKLVRSGDQEMSQINVAKGACITEEESVRDAK